MPYDCALVYIEDFKFIGESIDLIAQGAFETLNFDVGACLKQEESALGLLSYLVSSAVEQTETESQRQERASRVSRWPICFWMTPMESKLNRSQRAERQLAKVRHK
jgi:hypothetical protein